MGLFFNDDGKGKALKANKRSLDAAFYNRLSCKVCPLNNLDHDPIEPHGSKRATVYMLGDFPNGTDISKGKHFQGDSVDMIHRHIPHQWKKDLRWNTVVQHRTPHLRNPEWVEVECCRQRIVADIERVAPKAIFGFGNLPLQWVSGFNGILLWRGRRMPVKVGDHVCWFFPFMHPRHLDKVGFNGGISEDERMFMLDLRRAFKEVEELDDAVVHSEKRARKNIELITECNEEALNRIANALSSYRREPLLGIDYETNRLRPYSEGARILTISVGTPKQAVAFPYEHRVVRKNRTFVERVRDMWVRFLEKYKGRKAVHNLQFEMEWTGVMFHRDLLRLGTWDDSMTGAAILDERRGKAKPGPFSLEFQVQLYFGFNLKKLSDVDRIALDSEALRNVLEYNGLDAKYHAGLMVKQEEDIRRDGLWDVYRNAVRRIPTLTLSQIKGVPVHQPTVRALVQKYRKRIEECEADIHADPAVKTFESKMGRPYVSTSNPDTLYLFKNILHAEGLTIYDKSKKQDRDSVAEEALKRVGTALAKNHLASRKARKVLSTYLEPMLEGSPILYPDGMLHAQFNPVWAETGRLSCEEPNLQNYPKRNAETKEVRKALMALKGKRVWSIDYGQIEARVIAMFTRDPAFVKTLWDRYDVHGAWARVIAESYPKVVGGRKGLEDKKKMKDFRTVIKNAWTFPLFFGAQLSSVCRYLAIPEEVITPHYNDFWEQFKATRVWQGETLAFYQKHGYVECLTGRRRRGPLTINQVYNSGVQGTAAEIIMDGMCRLSETGIWDYQPEINVHDDLTFMSLPEDRDEEIIEQILTIMLDVPFDFVNVPITVEVATGANWDEMEEVGTFSSDSFFKKGKRL